MSWQRIVLPVLHEVDPKVVEIGSLGRDIYERENKPEGFGMFHASEESEDRLNDRFFIYLTPVAAEMCSEIAERFSLEPCEAPGHNDSNIAFVLGDPRSMSLLKGVYQAQGA